MDRQIYLALRREITPDIKQGIYPFKDVKLSRADIEWLLATHKNNEQQLKDRGLDLRGADLYQMDLHGLPLVYMQGGLSGIEWNEAILEHREMARVHIQGAKLRK